MEAVNQLRCVHCAAHDPNSDGNPAEYLYKGTSVCAVHLQDEFRALLRRG